MVLGIESGHCACYAKHIPKLSLRVKGRISLNVTVDLKQVYIVNINEAIQKYGKCRVVSYSQKEGKGLCEFILCYGGDWTAKCITN